MNIAHIQLPQLQPQIEPRLLWRVQVRARDLLPLCRALNTCDALDILRCAPVLKHGEARVRVEAALPAYCLGAVLHKVLLRLDNAEIGRVYPLD